MANGERTEEIKEAFAKARKSSNIDYHKVPDNKSKKGVVFPSIIIILIIGALGIYWYLANNPKTIFKYIIT